MVYCGLGNKVYQDSQNLLPVCYSGCGTLTPGINFFVITYTDMYLKLRP